MKFTYTREFIGDLKSQLEAARKPTDTLVATSIIENNKGGDIKMWVGTQLEYDEIAEPDLDTVYLVRV